jgi:hypothetical protein
MRQRIRNDSIRNHHVRVSNFLEQNVELKRFGSDLGSITLLRAVSSDSREKRI